jgi:hypothetical protein
MFRFERGLKPLPNEFSVIIIISIKQLTINFYFTVKRCIGHSNSGWKDAYERQIEYTRRDLFMGKLNPEKFSQRLQDLNRYLDFIPIKKQVTATKLPRHMESHCQKMKSDPSWDEQSHLNRQSICWHLEKNLGDSRIWKIS